MKTFILLAFVLSCSLSFGQTKIIAHKSHGGNLTALSEEQDGNFGIAPTRLDTVIKISDTSIVEINTYGWRDTVYNHPNFLNPSVTLEQLKARYPRITFIGFEPKPVKSPGKPKKRSEKKGSLYLMALLSAGMGLYTFKGKLKTSKSEQA